MAGLLGGGGGGLRGHGELPLNADINVTSLVDVAFVLLIIFMITAPIMQGAWTSDCLALKRSRSNRSRASW